jgi:hypothetical protein
VCESKQQPHTEHCHEEFEVVAECIVEEEISSGTCAHLDHVQKPSLSDNDTQTNSIYCGVFVIEYCDRLARGKRAVVICTTVLKEVILIRMHAFCVAPPARWDKVFWFDIKRALQEP